MPFYIIIVKWVLIVPDIRNFMYIFILRTLTVQSSCLRMLKLHQERYCSMTSLVFHFDVETTFPYQFWTKNYNLIKLSSHSASEFDTPKSDKRRLVTSGAEQENSKWEELLCWDVELGWKIWLMVVLKWNYK